MNDKFVKARKFVSENRTYFAFCAGSIATSAAIIYLTRGETMLRLTKEHAELLKQGGSVRYELKDQTLHLINVPAAEALASLS